MKKLLLIIVILFVSLSLKAQNPVRPSDTTSYYYCSVGTLVRNVREGMIIMANFGSDSKFYKDPEYSFLMPDGTKLPTTKNPVDVFNFMGSKGWRMVTHYTSSTSEMIGATPTEFYIFEKKRQP